MKRKGILIWERNIDDIDILVYLVRENKKARFDVYAFFEKDREYIKVRPINPKFNEVLQRMLEDLTDLRN